MGIGSFFRNVGKFVLNSVKKGVQFIAPKTKEEQDALLNGLKNIAMIIGEQVSNLDLNGDGRINAANEIVNSLEKTGKIYGAKLFERGRAHALEALKNYVPSTDLKRYLLAARLVTAEAERLKLIKPSQITKAVNGIIEAAVNEMPESKSS